MAACNNSNLTYLQDFYVSPADPAFYFHHTMIDRIWWIWQNQNPATRLGAISGGISFFGPSPRNGTLNDPTGLDVNGPNLPLRDLLDTMSGPFCYIYE